VDWHGSAIVVSRARKLSGVGSTKGKRVLLVEIGPARRGAAGPTGEASRAPHCRRCGRVIFPGQHGGHLDRSHISRDWAALKRDGHLEETFLRDAAERAEVSMFGADPVAAD
jgi:hypothetical protein